MSKGIKIHRILQPGAVSNFDAYFREILMIKGKNPGGGGGGGWSNSQGNS